MPDLLPVTITDAQVLASPLYKALEAVVADLRAQEPSPEPELLPDHVEALIDPDGKIYEPRTFPMAYKGLKGVEILNSSADFWRANKNTGYAGLIQKGWTVARWTKEEENQLTSEQWARVQKSEGRVVDGRLI